MAISFIQAASANAATVNISTPQVNDLILVFAYNNASTTIPTLPAGYTSLQTNSSVAQAMQCGFQMSAGKETNTSTWTNATNIVCLVYRGARTTGASGTSAGNSAILSYPTLTLQATRGSSWVAGLGGAKGATAGMNGTTTALTQNRTSQTTVNGLDTNGGVTSFAAQSLTVTGSGRWLTASVELLAQPAFEGDDEQPPLYALPVIWPDATDVVVFS